LLQLILFDQAADQEYEKEKLNERVAKLSGGVAVIQVLLMFNTAILCIYYAVLAEYNSYRMTHLGL
jgi:hypothetical protein